MGRLVEGIVPKDWPSPAFCVGDVEPPPEDFRLMATVADADAEFDASAEVAVAVSVTWRWLRLGALSLACTSTRCPALSPPTLQSDLPDGAQTEKVGDTLLGDVDSLMLAVPLVPLLSQTQMANLTVVCGFTELTPSRVWILRHKVPGGGVVGVADGVGVAVGVCDGVGVAVGVAIGDLAVPPGVTGFGLVLFAGAGSGCAVPGAADEPGLGCGRTGGLALVLGWVLGTGGVVLAEARRTASARSTGMLAGCWARPLAWLTVRVRGSVLGSVPAGDLAAGLVVLGAGLLGAAEVQAFVVAWRAAGTPVSIMLTAP